jgi:hypothetical protein
VRGTSGDTRPTEQVGLNLHHAVGNRACRIALCRSVGADRTGIGDRIAGDNNRRIRLFGILGVERSRRTDDRCDGHGKAKSKARNFHQVSISSAVPRWRQRCPALALKSH